MPIFSSHITLYEMLFEWTQTFRSTLARKVAKIQFESTKDVIRGILQPYKATAVAELTIKFNIHYHAIIEIVDNDRERMLFVDRIRDATPQIGIFTFRPVQFEESYREYLFKDLNKTTSLIGQSPIVKDDFNLLPAQTSFFILK